MRHTDALAALAALEAVPGAEVSSSARAVYMALLIRTDDNGLCWPSQSAIGRAAGMNAQNVRRHLGALVAAGLLAVESGGGRTHTSLYRLAVEVVPNPVGSDPLVTRERGSDPTRKGVGSDAKGGRIRPTNVKENVERTRAAPDPERDGHETHRPGDCEECDRGRARVLALCGDLSVWTPANDPRIGQWS